MGFKVPKRDGQITFPGTIYEGIEITCVLDVPLSVFSQIAAAASGSIEQVVEANRLWAEHALKGWNIDDDKGKAIKATVDNFIDQPPAFISAVVLRWIDAVTEMPAPLEEPSPNGALSAASQTSPVAQ